MPSSKNQVIWTVSALNHEVKTLLERGIGSLWLEGEISNLSKPASGHWYFSLKDNKAQIRVAMFKSKNARVAFAASNGQQVLIKASVSLYEARGEFQVIAEHMEEAGTGKLMREFEALKAKLKTEGLFEARFKQNLPRYPKTIGIITSPTGAAIRDALSVLKRRCPASNVIIYPCVVQGAEAAQSIMDALGQSLNRDECDVLLLIRGGGSIEDMWCFNDENLAHLIHQSTIPIITGIGHEIDFTIADFVADYRAPTPSVAAESASLDTYEITQQIDYLNTQLFHLMQNTLQNFKQNLSPQQHKLLALHPKQAIASFSHRLDLLNMRLIQANSVSLSKFNHVIDEFQLRLKSIHSIEKINSLKIKLMRLQERLTQEIKNKRIQSHQKLIINIQKLETLSPLKTMSRGFAAVTIDQQNLHSIKQVEVDKTIKVYLKDGSLITKVKRIKAN